MKKLLCVIFSIFIFSSGISLSAETSGDLWDNWSSDSGYGAKPVSDEEFEKAIEQVDAKVNKWKNRAKKKLIPKGKERTQSNETEQIKQTAGKNADPPIVCLSTEIMIAGEILPIGHYQVKGEIEEGQTVLNLYQAQHLMAKIPAIETKDDFNKDELWFADFITEEDGTLKIIYGSVDFNAYAVVQQAQID